MEDVRLNASESACVKRLAELFENGVTWSNAKASLHDPEKPLGVPEGEYDVVLATMEHIGAIENVTGVAGARFFYFQITPRAVQHARAIQDQESKKAVPRDIVAEIKETARRNPIVARLIIGFVVLAAMATLVGAILTIIDKVIDLSKKLGAG